MVDLDMNNLIKKKSVGRQSARIVLNRRFLKKKQLFQYNHKVCFLLICLISPEKL